MHSVHMDDQVRTQVWTHTEQQGWDVVMASLRLSPCRQAQRGISDPIRRLVTVQCNRRVVFKFIEHTHEHG